MTQARLGNATPAGGPHTGAVLEVEGLSVDFYVEPRWYPAAIDVSYRVEPGQVVAVVGESGSGKTQSSMALMGLLPVNGRASGSAKLLGRELIGLTQRQLEQVRGRQIGMVFQEPMTALNPVYTIGFQIAETLRAHRPISVKAARAKALDALRLVDMPEPEERLDSYPHQLSGGQRQRAMIAQALALDPALLIADEPTTALDVTVQAEVLNLLRDLQHRISAGIVLITHDMGVVADIANHVCVMRAGRVVEQGPVDQIFYAPTQPYSQALLAAVPRLDTSNTAKLPDAAARPNAAPQPKIDAPDAATPRSPVAFEARAVCLEYRRRGGLAPYRAVDNLNLTIAPGEVLGLVGESGSGKTTVGRAAVGLLRLHSGSLEVEGMELNGIRHKDLRQVRRMTAMVFQDPGSSLNPRLPVGESIGEPLLLARQARGQALDKAVSQMLDQVKLASNLRNRYPHELSGGQRQRVGIARALALTPKLLIADEPTSALDVSVQAALLDLFRELQREHGFACLFISHDLAVVQELASRIAVMSKGRLVEVGPAGSILSNPQNDYTRNLIAAVPLPDPRRQRERRLGAT